jgi:hypothetical protein
MQGSFEKKVQEKLDELKLNPSAPVWEKIELQIQPEKKRRRGIFWVPFLIFLLAGTGWWFFYSAGDKPVAAKLPIPVKNTDLPVSGQNDPIQQEKETTAPIIHKRTVLPPATVAATEKGAGSFLENKGILQTEKTILVNNKSARATDEQNDLTNTGTKGKSDADGSLLQAITPVPETIVVQENKSSNQLPAPIAEAVPATAADTVTKGDTGAENKFSPPGTDSGKVKPGIAAGKKGWQKTITLQGGLNLPAARYPANRDLFASPQQPSPATSYSNTSTGANPIKGGTSFAVGAGVVRAISERLELAVGLQYAYHRLHTNVGAFRRIDTGFVFDSRRMQVEGYYRNGRQSEYTIHYHLLQVPVSIGYRPIGSLPLTVTGGALYGRLLKSNALTYNPVSNGYYYNRQNITTNYFSVFSSVEYRITNRPGFQISVGPMIQYQFTPMQNEPFSQSGRLFVAGLKAGINY